MVCCVLATLLSGNLAAAGRIAVGLARRPSTGKFIALAALALACASLAPVAAAHVGHYAERASVNERSILEEVLAAPICSGSRKDGTQR